MNYGIVFWFLRHNPCVCNLEICNCSVKYVAIVKKQKFSNLKVTSGNPLNITAPRIFELNYGQDKSFIAVSVETIETSCLIFTIDLKTYLCLPVNELENE